MQSEAIGCGHGERSVMPKGLGWALSSFAESTKRMEVFRVKVEGRVLVIGHGPVFPERLWLCRPDSEYSDLRSEIQFLVCCDDGLYTNPKHRLHHDVSWLNGIEGEEETRVCYESMSAQAIIKTGLLGERLFDWVMMFRVADIGEQLENGLGRQIVDLLGDGGRMMGSGGFRDVDSARGILSSLGEVEVCCVLPKRDYSGFLYSEHVGFVWRKS